MEQETCKVVFHYICTEKNPQVKIIGNIPELGICLIYFCRELGSK